jgi:hypothetical protein
MKENIAWLIPICIAILWVYLVIEYPKETWAQRERRLCEDSGGIYLKAHGRLGLLGGGGVDVDCVFAPLQENINKE